MNSKLEQWQRLSPLSVIFFLGKSILRLLKDVLPALAPAVVIILASDSKFATASLIVAALIVLLLGGSVLQFWFFKFRRDGDKVLINDGVFKKNHRVIRFERVQNINILAPIYFRPFRLVTMQIETAGSKGNEADLAGIPLTLADQLRELILQYQTSNQAGLASFSTARQEPVESKLVATASIRDVVAYGVSSNGVFWLLAVLAPIVGAMSNKLSNIVADSVTVLTDFFGGGSFGAIVSSVLLLFILLCLMFLFSILGAIYRYYGYQLSKNEQTLKRRSGLITRFEEALKLVKVQAFITQSNIIGRLIKRQNVILGQVVSSFSGAPTKASLFVVPARTEQQLPELLGLVFADAPASIAEEKIDRRYILKTWLVWFMLPMALVSGVIILQHKFWYLVVPIAICLLALPLIIRRWSMFRFGFTGGYGVFQSGLFGFRRTVFPLYKVQQVEIKQSPVQRRRNLATLRICLASGVIVVPYLPLSRAQQWFDDIQETVFSNKSPWY